MRLISSSCSGKAPTVFASNFFSGEEGVEVFAEEPESMDVSFTAAALVWAKKDESLYEKAGDESDGIATVQVYMVK